MSQAYGDSEGQKRRVRIFSWSEPAIGIEAARSIGGVDFVRKLMNGVLPAPPIFNLIDIRMVKVERGER